MSPCVFGMEFGSVCANTSCMCALMVSSMHRFLQSVCALVPEVPRLKQLSGANPKSLSFADSSVHHSTLRLCPHGIMRDSSPQNRILMPLHPLQQSAVAFVEMLDVRTSLKVDQDELIAHMLAAGAFTDADLAMLQQVPHRDKLLQPEPRGGRISALQSQSLSAECSSNALSSNACPSNACSLSPVEGTSVRCRASPCQLHPEPRGGSVSALQSQPLSATCSFNVLSPMLVHLMPAA
eukprot:1161218-Pelagomonas_calceolata.AAC.11